MNEYTIQRMNREELDIAVSWAAKEGWNPGLDDADCYWLADGNGFFVGKINNEIISFGSAVCYDEHFAFCGFYIVKPEYRGKGYGIALTKKRLEYAGNRNIGIDGVLENVKIYERIGYRYYYKNFRYKAENLPQAQSNACVVPLNQIPQQQLLDYDRQCFPAPRAKLLECWISKPQRTALAFYDNNTLKGFGVIRAATDGLRIGPLFADNKDIARELLLHLAASADGNPVFIDIPENNPQAMEFVDEFAWQQCFATARMYMRGEPEIQTQKVYAITNFELG